VPAHIVCIGANRVQVAIGSINEPAELAAVVDRIGRLLDAGYDTVDIISTATSQRSVT
jgi:hypothetical protein